VGYLVTMDVLEDIVIARWEKGLDRATLNRNLVELRGIDLEIHVRNAQERAGLLIMLISVEGREFESRRPRHS
jgi:hypothetical protein